jgi:hypothetical protein
MSSKLFIFLALFLDIVVSVLRGVNSTTEVGLNGSLSLELSASMNINKHENNYIQRRLRTSHSQSQGNEPPSDGSNEGAGRRAPRNHRHEEHHMKWRQKMKDLESSNTPPSDGNNEVATTETSGSKRAPRNSNDELGFGSSEDIDTTPAIAAPR